MRSLHHHIAKPFTPGELALRYGVSVKTMKTWTDLHKEKIGKRASKYFTTLQVKIIYECLGFSSEIINE